MFSLRSMLESVFSFIVPSSVNFVWSECHSFENSIFALAGFFVVILTVGCTEKAWYNESITISLVPVPIVLALSLYLLDDKKVYFSSRIPSRCSSRYHVVIFCDPLRALFLARTSSRPSHSQQNAMIMNIGDGRCNWNLFGKHVGEIALGLAYL